MICYIWELQKQKIHNEISSECATDVAEDRYEDEIANWLDYYLMCTRINMKSRRQDIITNRLYFQQVVTTEI